MKRPALLPSNISIRSLFPFLLLFVLIGLHGGGGGGGCVMALIPCFRLHSSSILRTTRSKTTNYITNRRHRGEGLALYYTSPTITPTRPFFPSSSSVNKSIIRSSSSTTLHSMMRSTTSSSSSSSSDPPAQPQKQSQSSSGEDEEGWTNYERLVRKLYQTNLFNPVKLGLENMHKLHDILGSPMDQVRIRY